MESTTEEELESLLDRQRSALRRLFLGLFFGILLLALGLPRLLGLGPTGWLLGGMVAFVGFVVLNGALGDFRAAQEAVLRRVVRR